MPGQYGAAKGTSIMVSMKDPAAAEQAFNALAEKGAVTMPMESTFWGVKFGSLVDQFGIPKFGSLVDQFGIPWMINCEPAAE